ncbi:MAG: cyclic nucleotide-binding domain-containing protein [Gammaproteobacteria bacterium]
METSRGTGGGIDFRRLPDIERLPPPYQVQLLSQARVQRCADGQVLFSAGDTDDAQLYLIDGMVLLIGNDASVQEVHSSSPEARRALDPSQPRRYSARAVGSATVLQVKRSLLEKLTSLAELQSEPGSGAAEATHDDPGNWMSRIARAPIFARLPPNNLMLLFERGTTVHVAAGEVVVAEGSQPNHLYVVQDGDLAMFRTAPDGTATIAVAELRPGDCFGAEALLTERPLDVSVRALTSGSLVRITREDFLRLIAEPVIQAIPLRQAGELVRSQRARWLDVRPAHLAADIKGDHALHIPLNELRIRLDRLRRQVPYIVTSDSTATSRAGVFILLDAGLDGRYLTEVAAVTPAAETPPPTAEATTPTAQAGPSAASEQIPPSAATEAAPEMSPTSSVNVEPAHAAAASSPAHGTLAQVAERIHHEIDAQVAALKQRVDHELAAQQRLFEQAMQEELRRRTVEIETRYQLMVTRKEQTLRKSYERLLAMASSLKQQIEEIHAAQQSFAEMLGTGLTVAEGDTTVIEGAG